MAQFLKTLWTNDKDTKRTNDSSETEVKSLECHIKREDEDIRIYAAITFAFLLIVVGIPLWWKTTQVYRVHVPYGRIDDLKDLNIIFPVYITIVSNDRASILTSYLSNTSSDEVDLIFSQGTVDMNLILKASSLSHLDAEDLFSNVPGRLILLEIPDMSRFTASHVVVGAKRVVYFSPHADEVLLGKVVTEWLVQLHALSNTRSAMETSNEKSFSSQNAVTNLFENIIGHWHSVSDSPPSTQVAAKTPRKRTTDQPGRRRMPPAAKYDITLSVVHPEPERREILWDVKQAIKNYMGPLLDALTLLSVLRVKSQWLYLVRLEGRPRQMQDEKGVWYSLSEQILPHIITPLEKKLGSGGSHHPTIQLVLYIPPCQTSPLLITSNRHNFPPSTAFISPRWGGVQIYNPPMNTCTANDAEGKKRPYFPDSSVVMSTFRKQLKLLIGVRELVQLEGVEQLPLPASGIRDWELDCLIRVRAMEHLISARITLKSLAELLGEISNIVITDEVGDRIWEAITKTHASLDLIHDGELHAGFNASRDAFLAAETAFSDPSLLALLYFPDDQKYAVYIPLFLPVMIPVCMSLRSIRKWWLSSASVEEEKLKKE